jgi:hypothetical protein
MPLKSAPPHFPIHYAAIFPRAQPGPATTAASAPPPSHLRISVMKRVVVSALVVLCAAQAAQAVAQTVADQCFALGDIAGQVASWRAHKKTKAQALDQAARYYKDPSDRAAVDAIIEKLYRPDAPHMTPDQASMAITSDCVNQHKGQAAPQQ